MRDRRAPVNYGFLIDNASCIGCHACSTACKSEHQVPLGVYRTWVKSVEAGRFPDVTRSFQVTRCNHCAAAPCVRICPTAAMHQRPDGIVDFDSDACIGCKACIQACPYDAIYVDPDHHTAAKCNFCAHRIDVGLEPACVVVCPEHAILAGDLDDPASEIARVLARSAVTVRKPEQGTRPKLFYIDGHVLAQDPTASTGSIAASTSLGTFSAATSPGRAPRVSQAAARISYDVVHRAHWGWPIALYLVTKHVAGGVWAGLATLALFGTVSADLIWRAGAVGLFFLAITLALLVYDLDRPDRFFFLLTRPQWRSWVARAAWILTAFAVLATGWWVAEGWFDSALRPWFAATVGPLGMATALYTAFLFAQAEGRDLWQAPHQILLMTAHALLLGASPLAILGVPGATAVMGAGALGSLVVTLVGDGLPGHTMVARLARQEMVFGTYRWWWLGGLVLGSVVPLAFLIGGWTILASLCAAVGLFLYSVALVLAPQRVPNS